MVTSNMQGFGIPSRSSHSRPSSHIMVEGFLAETRGKTVKTFTKSRARLQKLGQAALPGQSCNSIIEHCTLKALCDFKTPLKPSMHDSHDKDLHLIANKKTDKL